VVQSALGIIILGVVGIMALARRSEFPHVPAADRIASALRLHGVLLDRASGRSIEWQVHRPPEGRPPFPSIRGPPGVFRLGAGWANVPVLNLVMGAPLKVSAGTSSFILSLVDSTAAWVYLLHGAVLAVIVVPSMLGMMLGARIGARLLGVFSAATIRRLVI